MLKPEAGRGWRTKEIRRDIVRSRFSAASVGSSHVADQR